MARGKRCTLLKIFEAPHSEEERPKPWTLWRLQRPGHESSSESRGRLDGWI